MDRFQSFTSLHPKFSRHWTPRLKVGQGVTWWPHAICHWIERQKVSLGKGLTFQKGRMLNCSELNVKCCTVLGRDRRNFYRFGGHIVIHSTSMDDIVEKLGVSRGVIGDGESESGVVRVTTCRKEGARLERVGQNEMVRTARPIKSREGGMLLKNERCQQVGHRNSCGSAYSQLRRIVDGRERGRAVACCPVRSPGQKETKRSLALTCVIGPSLDLAHTCIASWYSTCRNISSIGHKGGERGAS